MDERLWSSPEKATRDLVNLMRALNEQRRANREMLAAATRLFDLAGATLERTRKALALIENSEAWQRRFGYGIPSSHPAGGEEGAHQGEANP